ncbi:hypothetical protein CO2235_10269 [Cupriavidus oxalaticus]|jgi:hypothetical protein|uniref:Uncharacterized protein n=1 Tax=Cupriavidus oxalaticus TaxID=96344 RepID=A0A976B950_9BURK|nr:hypothetical protein CO2235_10269 [Cupriavidus oxalaticus]
MLFRRFEQGWYQFNPALSVRRRMQGKEVWVPVGKARSWYQWPRPVGFDRPLSFL